MGLIFNKSKELTETEVRYAMQHTETNDQAAAFLGIHKNTYRRYALRFIDETTGKSLYKLHQRRHALRRSRNIGKPRYDIFDIIDGKHPNYNCNLFRKRLIDEGIIPDECKVCGFAERRITDFKVPLKIGFIDGNKHNFKLENIEVLCYNCFFLMYGDEKYKDTKW